ncbi:hypothetical protein PNEG_02650 [Pneumocystis murina B123]|uniref:Histone-lysine N-methyltransferase, H3 lysine-4 specific n=1 Tax=Pneumocystis murina (strain B123) TaxID=1069680 RepID=M7P4V5_PNEMU|nr:hypothetical protein PNEG_02650 [Pneumocystis murina B123]EMR08865.1 hypothetical protein PNEG_02650 [Pneumocystis murina B123]
MSKNDQDSQKENNIHKKGGLETPILESSKQSKISTNGIPRKKNYHIIYDPELISKEHSKGRKAIYRFDGEADPPLIIEDPRLKTLKYGKEKSRGRKTYMSILKKVEFDFDENSIGPDPPTQILVSNLSTLTTSDNISMHFKTFGDIQELEIQVNPMTGTSLGLCRIRYRKNQSNKLQGHHAAKNAVEKGNGMKVGTNIIKVEYDENGVKCKAIIEEHIKKTSLTNVSYSHKYRSSCPEESMRREEEYRNSDSIHRKLSRDHRNYDHYSPNKNDTRTNNKAYGYSQNSLGLSRIYNSNSQDFNDDFEKSEEHTHETSISMTADILKKINKSPYIFINEKCLPFSKFSINDLKKHLNKHDWTDICIDKKGFYIIFKDNQSAQKCFVTMNQTSIYQYRITMDLHRYTPTLIDQNSKFKNSFQPVDNVAEATNIIIKELSQVFMKDLKTKIIGPLLYELLDSFRFSSEIKHEKNNLAIRMSNIKLNEIESGNLNDYSTSNANSKTNEFYSKTNGLSFDGISKRFSVLPKFKKRTHDNSYGGESLRDSLRRSRNVDSRPLHHRLNDFANSHNSDSDNSDTDNQFQNMSFSDSEKEVSDVSTRDYNKSSKKVADSKKKTITIPRLRDYTSSDDDMSTSCEDNFLEQFHKRDGFDKNKKKPTSYETIYSNISDKQTKVKKNKRQNIDFTSSEEPSSEFLKEDIEDIQSSETETNESQLSEYEEKPKKKKHKKKSSNEIKKVNKSIISNEHANLDENYQISYTSTKTLLLDDDVDILLDIYGIQSIVKDEEDFMFLLEALKPVESAKIDNIALWAWGKKEIKTSNVDGYPVVTRIPKDKKYNRINKSGSARTEGYFTITDAEKSLYLPLRNKAIISTDSLTTSTTSRMNRINNRRLAVGIEMQKKISSSETDILRFNALKVRKKQLKFSKSPIHNWGLYAMEHIDMGDMVIEYVGEIVRQTVADIRERQYERQGIGSSYLFRIDDDTVVDATKKGNIARFINHSCDPSCTAKIIRVEGEKKIVIYAHRDIEKGEEITYDYKFPIEEVKIPCLCGAKVCRGTLN